MKEKDNFEKDLLLEIENKFQRRSDLCWQKEEEEEEEGEEEENTDSVTRREG